jgi:ABC-type branched-subunit amino acid transport system substrate-binding protein
MRASFRLGLLFSSTGPYNVVSKAMLNGAVLAIEEVNRDSSGLLLDYQVVNPNGELGRYAPLCAELLDQGIKHVVGCYTSSSRKEVIPLFEKKDALLWYPSHYEGFESSTNVIYTGAAPNQHIMPLMAHMLGQYGSRAFCVGSNYIWAWENNRILRETVVEHGGTVLGERYFPVGETDFAQVIEAIFEARPSFVFNTLIGTSAYQFFRDFRAAGLARGIDQPRRIPVASCSLSEPELEAIGPDAVDGHISSSVYFSSIRSAENERFLAAYAARFPDGPATSADAEASYVAVKLLASALAAAGTDDVVAVKEAVCRQRLAAPQGEVWIDEQNLHAHLTPRIGRSNLAARFDIVREAVAPVQPDPYLVRSTPRFDVADAPPRLLRVVR